MSSDVMMILQIVRDSGVRAAAPATAADGARSPAAAFADASAAAAASLPSAAEASPAPTLQQPPRPSDYCDELLSSLDSERDAAAPVSATASSGVGRPPAATRSATVGGAAAQQRRHAALERQHRLTQYDDCESNDDAAV